MGLFGRRQVEEPGAVERIAGLEAEVRRLASALRTLETEQSTLHDHVRRWMRRAVAAERRVEEANQDPPRASVAAPVEPPPPRLTMWGARRRIAERRARAAARGAAAQNGTGEPEPAETE